MYTVHNAEEYTRLSNVNPRIRGLVWKKNHWFVFLETPNGQPVEDMQNKLKSLENDDDYIYSHIQFNGFGFQLMSATGYPDIEKIKVMGSPYRGGDYVKVCIKVSTKVRDFYTKKIEDKIGFMTMEQYKTLCIFVILKSGCDDLLEPGLNPWR